MSTKLASDDVYSETSRCMMTLGGWGGESVFRKARKKIRIANGCLLHYNTVSYITVTCDRESQK